MDQTLSENAVPVKRRPPARRRSSFTAAEMKRTFWSSFATFVNNGYVKFVVACIFFAMCILYYKKVEQWGAVDSILFVVVTASTVGYGNIHPTSTHSRIFTIFLMIFGALVIFAGISSYLNEGIIRMNTFLAKSVTSRLKRTEVLFQRRVVLSVIWMLTCALFGALIFQQLEGWSYITALYFVVQTMMTVGYGDIAFNNEATKIFLCFFIIISTALLGLAINNIYALSQNRKVLHQRRTMLKLQRKLHFLADMNEGRGVNKWEFVLTILEHIGTLDHDKDIVPWVRKFQELDTYNNGILDQQQLALFSEQNAKECEEEIVEISLTTSNVAALPVAARSGLTDFRSRAMTVGLFSDQELFHLESLDAGDHAHRRAANSLAGGSDDSDGEDNDEYDDQLFSPSGKHSPVPLRTRERSSTTRKYSTATNMSDEEEGASPAASPSPLSAMMGLGATLGLVSRGASTPPRRVKRATSASRSGIAMVDAVTPRDTSSPASEPATSRSTNIGAPGNDDPTSPLHMSPDPEQGTPERAVVSTPEAPAQALFAMAPGDRETDEQEHLSDQFSPFHALLQSAPAVAPPARAERDHAARGGLPPLHPPGEHAGQRHSAARTKRPISSSPRMGSSEGTDGSDVDDDLLSQQDLV